MPLRLSGNTQADALLSKDPLALLVGMVLDQQVPLEWAFAAPAELKNRLGGKLDPRAIARMDPEDLVKVFVERPALHRYPASMARRVHELCRLVVDSYGAKAENIWTGVADASELVGRLKQLPGFGDQKARIFLALLGKQLGVRPDGWVQKSSPYGEPKSFRSVADIVDGPSLERVRTAKQQAKQAARAVQEMQADLQPPSKATKSAKSAKLAKPATAARTTKTAKPMKTARPTKPAKAITAKVKKTAEPRGRETQTRA